VLGHRAHPQLPRHPDDGGDQRPVDGVGVGLPHELPRDLDGREGQVLEVGEGSEARAEVVEGEAAACAGHLPSEAARGVQAADRGGLGDLQAEPLGLDLGHLELLEDPAAQLGILQRARRDVHLEAEALRARPRRGQGRDRPLHHPPIDPQHQVGALRDGQELRGPQCGLGSVAQADEQLVTADAARCQVDDRLRVQAHRALVQGRRDPLQHRHPPRGLPVLAGREQPRAVAARPFRLIEREVGLGERGLDIYVAADGRDAHADRDPDRIDAINDRDRAHDVAKALGQLHRDPGRGVRDDHGELVAAEPAQQDVGGQPGREGAGDLADHPVADGVAAEVVDVLEVVDVDEQQRRTVWPRGALGEGRGDAPPVGDPGQRVVVSEERQLLAGAVGLGDVARGAEHAGRHACGVGEHLAVALEDALGDPVGEQDAVGEGEWLQRPQRPRQGLLDHPDVVGMQERPVLSVVEWGAPGEPEQVEQAVRPHDDAVAHVPEPRPARGHRLQPAEPPLRGERAQRRRVLAVAVGLVDDHVKVPVRREREAGDVPPAGAAGRRRPPHDGGARPGRHGHHPAEHVGPGTAMGFDEPGGGGIGVQHRCIAHDEHPNGRLRRDLVPGHGRAIVAPARAQAPHRYRID
jgi:hypothetical protein